MKIIRTITVILYTLVPASFIYGTEASVANFTVSAVVVSSTTINTSSTNDTGNANNPGIAVNTNTSIGPTLTFTPAENSLASYYTLWF